MADQSPIDPAEVRLKFRTMSWALGPAVRMDIYVGWRYVGGVDAAYDPDSNSLAVGLAEIEPRYQGRGVGRVAYRALHDYAKRELGIGLASDTTRSDKAERLWSKHLSRQIGAKRVGSRWVAESAWSRVSRMIGGF